MITYSAMRQDPARITSPVDGDPKVQYQKSVTKAKRFHSIVTYRLVDGDASLTTKFALGIIRRHGKVLDRVAIVEKVNIEKIMDGLHSIRISMHSTK